jgi:hypothetical protein
MFCQTNQVYPANFLTAYVDVTTKNTATLRSQQAAILMTNILKHLQGACGRECMARRNGDPCVETFAHMESYELSALHLCHPHGGNGGPLGPKKSMNPNKMLRRHMLAGSPLLVELRSLSVCFAKHHDLSDN